jgi:hypothetical protein
LSLLLLALVACTSSSDKGGTAGTADVPTVRLSSAINTVIFADWTPVEGADATWIEYGPDTSYGSVAPERTSGEALVLGNLADTEVHLRLAVQTGDEVAYSDDTTITTGSLPTDLIDIGVASDSGADFGNYFVMSITGLGGGGGGGGGGGENNGAAEVVIFDRAGNVVWYASPASGFIPAARPSRDGKAILYLWDQTVADTDTAQICRVDLGGEDVSCLDTPGATHDFVELPDGSYSYGKDVVQDWTTYTLTGNSLTNMTQDGVETQIWNIWDELEPVPTNTWSQSRGGTAIDWTHFNGMWYDDDTASYYASFLMLREVWKVDGATGETQWVIGGDENEFDFDGTEFGPQHAPQLADGALLVFDNRDQGEVSRLAGYDLDETNFVATETMSIPHPDGAHATTMGDNHLMPNGYIGGVYGDTGDLFVFSPEGDVEWSAYPAAGTLPGQMYVYEDLYSMAPN